MSSSEEPARYQPQGGKWRIGKALREAPRHSRSRLDLNHG